MQKNNVEIILRMLVSLRSYAPYEHGPYEFLTSYLRARGYRVEYQQVSKNRKNLLAQKGRGVSSVLVSMHIDTVPPHSGNSHALTLRKNSGNYYGLGCFDMKGGIAAILSTLDTLSLKKHKLKLAFCVDEEGVSEGIYALARSSFIRDVAVAFSPEASIVSDSWKLPLVFTIGGRGRCVIRVVIPGSVAHGASDIQQVNSIEEAMRFISRLSEWRRARDPRMGRSSFFIRSIWAESKGLSLPDDLVLEIDYQTVYGETAQSVKVRLERFVHSLYDKNILDRSLKSRFWVSLAPRITPYIEPYRISTKNKYVKMVASLFRKRYGAVSYDYAKSVADQNVLGARCIPIITIGPIGGKPHEAGEWVSRRSLQELSTFYRELLCYF